MNVFNVQELLFKPFCLMVLNWMAIHQTLFDSIMKCEMRIRKGFVWKYCVNWWNNNMFRFSWTDWERNHSIGTSENENRSFLLLLRGKYSAWSMNDRRFFPIFRPSLTCTNFCWPKLRNEKHSMSSQGRSFRELFLSPMCPERTARMASPPDPRFLMGNTSCWLPSEKQYF
jgi:hypothetical protein